jgi:hypothetical protein
MLYSVLVILGILAVLYVAQLALRTYTNKTVSWESFQPKVQNAAPVTFTPLPEAPRDVAPSGPNPPNAQGPVSNPPETTVANDPLADANSETPIRDNLRHPENSFGPGINNTGSRLTADSGVASMNPVSGGVNNFSPEFAQNGGEFMNGITASDAFTNDSYAPI